ncbi:MAG: alkane 1-monooxygenase [Paracoccaceae bacterium]|nr:alkane 1-monooxygenase [Paracoccaceae bacterium]
MSETLSFRNAIPFWGSLLLIPLAWIGAVFGGWSVLLVFLGSWIMVSVLDVFTGLNANNEDPESKDDALYWYRLITLIWPFAQGLTVFGVIAYVTASGHLSAWELIGVAFSLGILSGAIGIVYAHELMHQKSRFERWLGDILMAMTLYSHFRTEHLLVHHRYIGTPRDPVTARYNEGFHRFFVRVLRDCPVSAWKAERARLAHKNLPVWHRTNPFWRYAALQSAFIALALAAGGWAGLGLFLIQAFVAIWQLELVNYIEHYGLTRKHLGNGKYEHTKPHHSWNASQKASNWLLINLQRHSDHHFKPDRRFPLLQTWGKEDAPQLPHGYAVMGTLAMIPPLWRRRMNPRVRAWRKVHYPEVTDWQPYKLATNPMPR